MKFVQVEGTMQERNQQVPRKDKEASVTMWHEWEWRGIREEASADFPWTLRATVRTLGAVESREATGGLGARVTWWADVFRGVLWLLCVECWLWREESSSTDTDEEEITGLCKMLTQLGLRRQWCGVWGVAWLRMDFGGRLLGLPVGWDESRRERKEWKIIQDMCPEQKDEWCRHLLRERHNQICKIGVKIRNVLWIV